jgi:hypothetical protein
MSFYSNTIKAGRLDETPNGGEPAAETVDVDHAYRSSYIQARPRAVRARVYFK